MVPFWLTRAPTPFCWPQGSVLLHLLSHTVLIGVGAHACARLGLRRTALRAAALGCAVLLLAAAAAAAVWLAMASSCPISCASHAARDGASHAVQAERAADPTLIAWSLSHPPWTCGASGEEGAAPRAVSWEACSGWGPPALGGERCASVRCGGRAAAAAWRLWQVGWRVASHGLALVWGMCEWRLSHWMVKVRNRLR